MTARRRQLQIGLAGGVLLGILLYSWQFAHHTGDGGAVLGRYSLSYAALLGLGGLALLAVLWGAWRLWRRVNVSAADSPAPAVTAAPAATPSPGRFLPALLLLTPPWLAVVLLPNFTWPLFVLYLLAVWSSALLYRFRRDSEASSPAAWTLAAVGALAVALSLNLSDYEGVARFGIPYWLLLLLGLVTLATAFTTGRQGKINFATAAFSLALTLVLIEVGLRALDVYNRLAGEYNPGLDREFHHNYAPFESFIRHPETLDEHPPILNEINALGMRGPEIVGEADVLLLGDSFIQADEVEWEATITYRLQQEVGPDTVVAGHGMLSWSPLLEWNWYLKLGRRFAPDVVFLFLFVNDFLAPEEYPLADAAYLQEVALDQAGRPLSFFPDQETVSSEVWYEQIEIVRLYRLFAQRLDTALLSDLAAQVGEFRQEWASPGETDALQAEARAAAGNRVPLSTEDINALLALEPQAFEARLDAIHADEPYRGLWRMFRPPDLWPEAQRDRLALSEDILRGMAEDVAADGGRLVLVYVPLGMQIGPQECSLGRYMVHVDAGAWLPAETGTQTWLAGVSARLGLDYLDPTGALQAESGRSAMPLYLRRDCHWSPAGHTFMAQYLADWLAAQP